MMIRAVLFDFDGVIVDSEIIHKKTFQEMLNLEIPVERWYKEFAGTGSRKIFTKLIKENNLEGNVDDLVEKRRAIFNQYVKEGQVPLVPGIKEFLQCLKDKKIKTAIVSGGHRTYIEPLLEMYDLSFDFVVSADDNQYRKPDPKVFLLASDFLNVNPEECLVIEDSYSGAQGARAANMKLVWIRPHISMEPLDCDLIIGDFTDPALNKFI